MPSWFTKVFNVKDDSTHPAPKQVYNRRLGALALSYAFCSGIYGYDSGAGATFSLSSFTREFGLDDAKGDALANLKSNIVSTFQAGAFFGVVISYFFNEKFGRKKTLLGFLVLFMIGVTLQVASQGIVGLMYAGRALTGMTVGVVSAISPVSLTEWSPPAARGLFTGLYEINYQLMLVVSFWLNYGVEVHIFRLDNAQWRIPLAVQYIYGGIGILLISLQPESYRWLIKAGHHDKARDALCLIRNLPSDHPYISYEIQAVIEQIHQENQLTQAAVLKTEGNFFQRSDFYLKCKEVAKIKNRVLLGISVMVWQNLSGINALNYYSPSIFKAIGLTGNSVSLLATGVFGIVKATSNIITVLFLLDNFGRRKPLLIGSALTAITMFYIAAYSQVSGSFDHTVKMDNGGKAAIAMVYLFSLFYSASWNAVPFIFCSEIFPSNLRNFCMAICACWQWLMQFVIVYANPYMMANIKYGTFYFFAAFLTLSVPFTYFLIPETKGISLENMDILFSIKGTAIYQRKKADEIIELRKQDIVLGNDGKATVDHKENTADNELLMKVPTTSTKSVRSEIV